MLNILNFVSNLSQPFHNPVSNTYPKPIIVLTEPFSMRCQSCRFSQSFLNSVSNPFSIPTQTILKVTILNPFSVLTQSFLSPFTTVTQAFLSLPQPVWNLSQTILNPCSLLSHSIPWSCLNPVPILTQSLLIYFLILNPCFLSQSYLNPANIVS
jgi:hypothetical protein